MTSGTEPPNKTIAPRMRMGRRPLSTVKCDKQSVCLDKDLVTPRCPRSVTNPPPLAGRRVRSMARKVPVSQRAWLSIPPPPTYKSPNSNSSSYPQSPYGSNPQMYQQGR